MFISHIKFLNPKFDEQTIHEQLYAAFPANMGRVLYSKENKIQNNELTTFAVVYSEKRPFSTENIEIVGTNEIKVKFKNQGIFDFELKLNPTYKKHGKRLPQKIQQKRYAYVQNRLEKAGCLLLNSLKESRRETIRVTHKTGTQFISAYTYKGTLLIKDPEKLKCFYENGIGHCKAYGCGMLLLKK